jgi:hypothetical protein
LVTTEISSATTKQASSPIPNALDVPEPALRTAPDGGQEPVDLVLCEPDAAVPHLHLRPVGDDPHDRRSVLVHRAARRDRVDRVLQELAHEHPRTGVEVMRQKIDYPAQIHLEGVSSRKTTPTGISGGGRGLGDQRLLGRHALDATHPRRHPAPEWPQPRRF